MAQGILDSWGNPIKTAKPGKDWPNPIVARDRAVNYPIRGLSPDDLWSRIMSAYDGDVAGLQETFEQMIALDGHLSNLDQRRRGAVAGLKWDLQPYADRPGYGQEGGEPEPQDVELCNFVSDILFRIDDFQEHVKSLMDAVGKGFAVLQIRWVDDGDALVPVLRSIPQRLFTFREKRSTDVVQSEMPRLLTDTDRAYGIPLEPMRYIVARFKDRNVEPWRCGIMWSCIWFWLRKHEALSQLMATGERFADPGLVGYYSPESQNSDIPSKLNAALASWGAGGHVAIPGTGGPITPGELGTLITTPQANLTIPQDYWQAIIADCNAEMSKAFSGGNLITDTRQGTGTYGAAEAQAKSEDSTITQPDFDWLAGGAIEDLVQKIVLVNKGPEAARRLPKLFAPDLQPADDQEAIAAKFEAIGRTMWSGVDSVPEPYREMLGLPPASEMVDEEEPEVEPAVPAPVVPTGEPADEEAITPEEETAIAARMDSPLMAVDERVARILTPVHACGDMQAAAVPGEKDLAREIGKILAMIDPYTEAAAEGARDRVTAYLLRMKNPPRTPQAFQRAVLRHIQASYASLSDELEAAGMGEWFEDTYRHYRLTDRSAWPGGQAPPIAMQWGTMDTRMVEQMTTQPLWYFSKYTDNVTYRRPMQSFLAREYADNGAQLFVRDEAIVKKFASRLGKTIKKLDGYEVDRIARTSVARAREEARLMQMYAAGVQTATVTAHPDCCPICAQYDGKTIDVQSEVAWVTELEGLEPAKWEKAIKKHGREAMRGVPPHEFHMGAGGPLYHPNCRCGIDIKY